MVAPRKPGAFFQPLLLGPVPADAAGGGSVNVTPTNAALTLTTYAPTVSTPRNVTPGAASLTLTTYTPTIATPRNVTPGVQALAITTFAPTIATPRNVTPGCASLTLTAFAPTVATPVNCTPGVRSLTLTTYAPAVSAGVTVVPGCASLTLTGFAPTVAATANVVVRPGVAALGLVGFAPMVAGDAPSVTSSTTTGMIPSGGIVDGYSRGVLSSRRREWKSDDPEPTPLSNAEENVEPAYPSVRPEEWIPALKAWARTPEADSTFAPSSPPDSWDDPISRAHPAFDLTDADEEDAAAILMLMT